MQPGIPIKPQQPAQENRSLQQVRQDNQFQRILDDKLGQGQLTFSAHAMQRLEQRDIHLTSHDLARLQEAVNQVAAKGGNESLIHMNDVSYVINIPNRTVITAVDDASSSGNVFTQIDSALVLT
ncbi:MAG: flagellar protein [Candidatus Cloacimonetes bacterium]|nr:flagellar protein [Candidatus Cloacimonadota bacterium]